MIKPNPVKQYGERLTCVFPNDLKDDFRGLHLLRTFGGESILATIDKLVDADIDNCIGIGYDFLGFIESYYHIANYFLGHADISKAIIVDIGCCTALHQVFFSQFKGYIGIDMSLKGTVTLNDNAAFVQGRFGDLVESGEFVITDDMIGIANMSLVYFGNDKDHSAFNLFKRSVKV